MKQLFLHHKLSFRDSLKMEEELNGKLTSKKKADGKNYTSQLTCLFESTKTKVYKRTRVKARVLLQETQEILKIKSINIPFNGHVQ